MVKVLMKAIKVTCRVRGIKVAMRQAHFINVESISDAIAVSEDIVEARY